MAMKRVTMQDIADACGLSRNTVSKIFNGRGAVPEATRTMVLEKAKALGYWQLQDATFGAARPSAGTIALMTTNSRLNHNFGLRFLTSFTDAVSRAGFLLKIFEISPDELRNKQLPPHLVLDQTSGFACIRLFDREYLEMLSSCGIPLVTVDSSADSDRSPMNWDFVSMRNIHSVMSLTERMIRHGAKRIGFVGDRNHCNSFYQRWVGYNISLHQAGLSVDEKSCILKPDGESYGNPEWIAEQLRAMPSIPDAFYCANDFLAINLMSGLELLGLSVPKDVMVAGFDGSPEAAVVNPGLSTAAIPSEAIGQATANLLFARIADPKGAKYQIFINTTPIFRESTRD